MSSKTTHVRVNDILLGPLERPAIRWLVRHMPLFITPDILTGVGFFAAMLVAVSYWLTNYDANFLWLASLGFALNWFGDSLDGSLARYRKIERPKFGYFIDHTMDALTQLVVLVGIGLSPYVSLEFALLVLAGYFMVSIHTYITNYVSGVFKISYGRFGPTEARVLAIIGNTLVYFAGLPQVKLPQLNISLYDSVFVATGIILIGIYVVATAKQAIQLSAAERGAN